MCKYCDQANMPSPTRHGNFTDQQRRLATADDLVRAWGGARDGSRFRCYFCGHRFAEGDQYRWVYTNNMPRAGGNPFVCEACDGPNEDVRAEWAEKCEQARTAFWWFTQREECRD